VAPPDAHGASLGLWLASARPNPSVDRVVLQYSLPVPARVQLGVFDARGVRVATLVDEREASGDHAVVWNAADDRGHVVSRGVYYARLECDGWQRTTRIVRLRP